MSTIIIHSPGSSHSSLADRPNGFDRTWFMGKWVVAWSTLPMWKEKKDVTIIYTPVAGQSKIDTTFDDLVEYRSKSADSNSKPSTVRGIDTLSTGYNGATFDWKGAGLLFFVHSHWEVLGYGKDEEHGLEWAVTYFSKTLFTPAGLDIYIRKSPSVSNPGSEDNVARTILLKRITEAVQAAEDETLRRLTSKGFEVPGTV
ncbi:uncharacterized protein L203_103562 [Cryptococcus depauperatus CBS 7841]|uniref:Uncharacterized protein n=1 Tax=Cryptococcus depauperatus CBS 7841 TaxID=1295531 RepID=A0AAJ8JTV0_9TREE